MPSTKEIRVRIGSIKNTQQTTRAMKMVAASKLKRAQDAITNSRPYAEGIEKVVKNLMSSQSLSHPLCDKKDIPAKTLFVVFSSDRGLCGGFNANISKFAMNEVKNTEGEKDIIFLGRKAESFFRNRGVELKRELIENMAKEANYSYAKALTEKLINIYQDEEYTNIVLIFNEFKSALEQIPTRFDLLPIAMGEEETSEETTKDYIFKPSPVMMIETLVDRYVVTQVQRAIFESLASEYGARMNAMENATKNAGELIDSLTLTYNKMRQAAITTELIEITSGAEAIAN